MANIVLQRTLNAYNVKDFGAKGDGSTDDTAAITNAMNAASNAGGGIVFFPAGTYITTTQTLLSTVNLLGAGPEASTIKLKNGANADLFSAQTSSINLSASQYSGILGTLSNFSIQGLTLDGNKANQSSGTSYPLRFYGYNFTLRDLEILNGYSGGILTDWNYAAGMAEPSPNMESRYENLKIHGNNGIALQTGGPHDSHFKNILAWHTGSHGFHFAPNSVGALCENLHPYSLATSVSAVGFLVEANACKFVNCMAEGSDYVEIALLGSQCCWIGGMVFSGGVVASMVGIQLGQNSGNTPISGQINQSAGVTTSVTVSENNIHTTILGCTGGALNFVRDQHNDINVICQQSSGNAITGSPNFTNNMIVQVDGLSPDSTNGKGGMYQVKNDSFSGFTVLNRNGGLFSVDTYDQALYVLSNAPTIWYSDQYATVKAKINATGNGEILLGNASSLYSGSGAPSNGTGSNGDYYFRSDTPGTANQRIYVKSSGSWTGIV